MITLVRNSGGCITTWDNSDPISGGNILVCSNNKIHQKMLKFLKPIS
jgi:fructose-1,6-bisphosphatase/inositol monophosphatase family enzyme